MYFAAKNLITMQFKYHEPNIKYSVYECIAGLAHRISSVKLQ